MLTKALSRTDLFPILNIRLQQKATLDQALIYSHQLAIQYNFGFVQALVSINIGIFESKSENGQRIIQRLIMALALTP